ncbi:anthranilate phosphoribosyltransferase [Chengkuizengella axinellae]|uniref:Anthranilate phosphoribosyltransferase n=1 Tax=Chengkuizengella axinellae TaxID=3064388 RepID=A0ABT9J089_9BACL|nr:anthranilate phosphoribosyltransferase [Chengkuizengella sp. 2205SS18-9]MDP5275046.1 anthranilate phosphoribosyltransferase [Chengkuizengella sp. 2205SS18-9]
MISLLKEVGRGKRGAKDLSYKEALKAAEHILTGKATPSQIGAFLIAERIKMESQEEIQAFIEVCKLHSLRYPMENSIDCAGPYDGRNSSFIATIPTAFVLAACGLPVTLHGGKTLPPKLGVTLYDVMNEMCRDGNISNKNLLKGAEEAGILFVETEKWCPPLEKMRTIREEIGMRTLFNTVEKYLRFSNSSYMAVGVFHGTVFEKMAKLLSNLGIQKGIIVQGMEGSEDISVEKQTRTLIVKDEQHELFIIDPEVLEMQCDFPEVNWTVEKQTSTALDVLKGTAELPFHNMVILNSAVRLWVADKVDSIEQGIYSVRHILEQGLAYKQYQKWIRAIH